MDHDLDGLGGDVTMRKILMGIGAAAAALSIVIGGTGTAAAGGMGIALGDADPTYGERIFIQLESNRIPKVWPRIKLVCKQDNVRVYGRKRSTEGGGAYFRLKSPKWTGGGAVCTATLQQETNSGWSTIDTLVFAVSG